MKKAQDHLKVLSCARDGLMPDRSCTVCLEAYNQKPFISKKKVTLFLSTNKASKQALMGIYFCKFDET